VQYSARLCNTMQYHAIPCNTMQYHVVPCNTVQYHAIPCNTMQYHECLIMLMERTTALWAVYGHFCWSLSIICMFEKLWGFLRCCPRHEISREVFMFGGNPSYVQLMQNLQNCDCCLSFKNTQHLNCWSDYDLTKTLKLVVSLGEYFFKLQPWNK